MRGESLAGLLVDHRAHVGAQVARVAHVQLVHGPFENFDDPVGHIVLQVEDAQCGATLAGTLEGRLDDVGHHLFGQGGGVDDHGVHATGLGDQRRQGGAFAGRQGTIDDLGKPQLTITRTNKN